MKKKGQQKFYSKEIKKSKTMNEDYKKAITFIIVLLIVLVLFGALFIFNGMFVTKDHFQDKTTTTTTTVSYDPTVITVSNLFKVEDKDYYVLLFDASDEKNGFVYKSLALNYKDETPLYSIDMSNAMNRKYYDTKGEENTSPKKYTDVMVTRPTLMHIKKGKVTEYITDVDTMVKYLAPRPEEDKK